MNRTHWHLCISAPPPDLALPLLMFGFEQMASVEDENTGSLRVEPRLALSCRLAPPPNCSLCCKRSAPNVQSLVQLVLPTSPGREDQQPESQTQAGSELLPPAFVQHVLQHAPCSTVTCEQGIQRVLGTRVTDPWWLLPPQTHSMRLFRRDLTSIGTE